jgi:alkylation response protein AidB-like acyl-CoA dehydrogenase
LIAKDLIQPLPILQEEDEIMRQILSDLENKLNPLTHLNKREIRFKKELSDFCRRHIAPKVIEMDENSSLDDSLVRRLFDKNYMSIEIPAEFGGRNGTFFEVVIAIEEIAKTDPSVAVFVDVQNTLVNNAISRWASTEQKEALFPALSQKSVGAFAITERNAGSDAYALSTTAEKVDGGYLLNGHKHLVTNSAEADFFIIFAKLFGIDSEEPLTAFIINCRETEGFTVSKREDKLGIKASSTCSLGLNNAFVPEDSILGGPGLGKQIALETLTDGRIGIAAQMVGLSDGALCAALKYSKERQQFERNICDFQGIHFSLAEMATSVEAARLLVYNAARLKSFQKNKGEYFTSASMAKYFAANIAGTVTSRVMDIFSGVGYLKNSPAEKLYRDAKIGTIYEGTSNMQLRSIAKMLVNFKEH